ncbi:MAG: lamin tail domain-containing protein, partial [Planctomycetes bacterium]|nr:lamin tail domain-containing protein [Planctomycetota bacterium]
MMQVTPPRAFILNVAILVSCLVVSWPARATVMINELMASNRGTLLNSLGESGDWIELHNDGDDPVDLGGLYLTDDATEPTQWQIPSDTHISGKGYLIIWADGQSSTGELHASFRLNASGEQLALYDSDGQTLLDSVVFDKQARDISFGRNPRTPDLWQYMDRPTPDAANTDGYFGLVADTRFSLDRGFFDQPFELVISTVTPEAFILYTTDGS